MRFDCLTAALVVMASVIRRLLLNMVDHEHGQHALPEFQPESELFFDRVEKRQAAAWVRRHRSITGRHAVVRALPGVGRSG